MNSVNLALKPNFWTILAYFLAANRLVSSDLAPVQTIFPDENISAVVRGSRIRIITAAKRLGLYSAFLARKAICFKSNWTPKKINQKKNYYLIPKFTVETIFWRIGDGTSSEEITVDICVAGIIVGIFEADICKKSLEWCKGVIGTAKLLLTDVSLNWSE